MAYLVLKDFLPLSRPYGLSRYGVNPPVDGRLPTVLREKFVRIFSLHRYEPTFFRRAQYCTLFRRAIPFFIPGKGLRSILLLIPIKSIGIVMQYFYCILHIAMSRCTI